MKPIHRQLFFTFLLGVIVGLCLLSLLSGHQHPSVQIVEDPSLIQAKLENTVRQYQSRLDSLDRINATIRLEVNKTRSALVKAKVQNHSLQGTIKDLLTVHYTPTDTVTRLANCDSLAIAVNCLLIQAAVKDSLYDSLTINLQTQITLGDSTNRVQQARYDTLQTVYRKTLSQEEALIQENAAQKKAIRKQKRGKGLMTALLGIVAGLFAFSTIK